MPTSLDALRSLTSNQANPDSNVQFRMLQQRRMDEMQRNRELAASSGGTFATGATGGDVGRLQRDMDDDPFMGRRQQARVADIEDQNQYFEDYNRPEATDIRDTQRQDKLQTLLAPAHVRGQYQVEAAHEAANGRYTIANMNNDASMARTQVQQDASTGRTQLAQTGQNDRAALTARLKALLTKQKAGYGWFSGDAEKNDNAELEALLGQMDGGDGAGTPAPTGTPVPQAGNTRARDMIARYGG